MANVTQEYVLKVTSQGLKEIVREIKALRKDLGGLSTSTTAAEKGFKKVSKSAGEYDRNMKGAANATNNSTKGFSKMAQGMQGTLVPAYATVAANVFALTAAFGALERAADTQILIKASQELAVQTGRSLTAVAANMKEITGSAISMKEALTSASIAASAGFDNSTIEELTQVARNASVALGRDMTDSLNRVFKGAIKAEPELLDELGIILRLDPAAREYAASIGKTVTELTTFEKQQAVVNAVLEQGQEKFGKLSEVDPNPYTQLSSAFKDVSQNLIAMVGVPLSPVIKFFAENTGALTAALILFSTSVLKKAIPALTELGANFEEISSKKLTGLSNFTEGMDVYFEILDEGKNRLKNASISDVIDDLGHTMQDFDGSLNEHTKSIRESFDSIWGDNSLTEDEKLTQLTDVLVDGARTLSSEYDIAAEGMTDSYDKMIDAGVTARFATSKTFTIMANAALKFQDIFGKSFTQGILKAFNSFAAITSGSSAAFIAGLTGDTKKLNIVLSDLRKRLDATTGSMVLFEAAILRTSKAFGFLGLGISKFIKFIPYIGQLYLAWQLLSSAVTWVFDLFRDSDAIDKTNNALEDQAKALDTAEKAYKEYNEKYKDTELIGDDVLKSLELQKNALTEMSNSLQEVINNSEGFEEFFGSDVDDFIENLERQAEVLSNFGYTEEVSEALEDFESSSGSAEERAYALADSLSAISKEGADLANNLYYVNKEVDTTFESFNKAFKEVQGSLPALTTAQKAIVELEKVLTVLSTTNRDVFADRVTKIDSFTQKFLGITELVTGYNASLADTKDALEDVEKAQDNLKDSQVNFLDKISDGVTKLARLAGADTGPTRQERRDQLFLNQQKELTLYQSELNALKEDQLTLIDLIVAKMQDQKNVLLSSVKLQENLARKTAQIKFELSLPGLSEQSKVDLTRDLEAYQRLINSKLITIAKLSSGSAEDAAKGFGEDLAKKIKEIEEKTNDTSIKEKTREQELAELEKEKLVISKNYSEALSTQFQISTQLAKLRVDILNSYVREFNAIRAGTKEQASLGKTVEEQIAFIKENSGVFESLGSNFARGNEGVDEYANRIQDLLVLEAEYLDLIKQHGIASVDAINTNIRNMDTQIAALEFEAEYLARNNTLLDERIDKQAILAAFATEQKVAAIATKLTDLNAKGKGDTEQYRDLERRLQALLVQMGKAEEVREAQLAKEITQRLTALKIEVGYEKQKLKFSTYTNTLATQNLNTSKLIVKAIKEGYGAKELEEYAKLLEEQKTLANRENFLSELKDSINEINGLNEIFDNLSVNLDGAQNTTEKWQASLLATAEIADGFGDKFGKGLAQAGIAILQLGEDLKSFKSISESIADALIGVGGAMKNAFEEGSAAAKAAAVVEGIGAVIKAWNSAPFPYNLPMVAITAANVANLLSQMGESADLGGATGGATPEQQAQDYKDSFGDNNIQGVDMNTNALVDSIDRLMSTDYALSGEIHALRKSVVSLKDSLDEVGKQLFKVGGAFNVGDITSNLGLDFSTSVDTGLTGSETVTKELLASGIEMGLTIKAVGDNLVGKIRDANLFVTQGILDVDTRWFGTGTDYDIKDFFFGISAELGDSIQRAFDDSLEVISRSAGLWGLNLADILGNKVVNIASTKINLTDKSPQEQGEIIAAFLSNATNKVLKATLPWIEGFRKAGEELTDTLFRLSEQSLSVNETLSMIGMSSQGIVDTLSDNQISRRLDRTNAKLKEKRQETRKEIRQLENLLANKLPSLLGMSTQKAAAAIAEFDDDFKNASQVMNAMGKSILLGSSFGFQDLQRLQAYYEDDLEELTNDMTSFAKMTWDEFAAKLALQWEQALLSNFEGNEDIFNTVAEKAFEALFSEEELRQFAEDNAILDINELLTGGLGEGTLLELLEKKGYDANNSLYQLADGLEASMDSVGDLRTILDELTEAGAFTGVNGAHLYALVLSLGAGFGYLADALEQTEEDFTDLIQSLTREIALFGLEGEALDLMQLSFDYSDALEEAQGSAEAIALTEKLYGLRRLEIVTQYNQEIVDSLDDAFEQINDAVLTVIRTSQFFSEVAYESLKIESLKTRLIKSFDPSIFEGFGDLVAEVGTILSDIDTSGTEDFTEALGQYVTFSQEVPGSIAEQIALANELTDAIMARYDAEVSRVEELKQLTLDIKGFLDDLLVGDLSPLTNLQRFNELSDRFAQDIIDVQSSDTETAAEAANSLLDNAGALLDLGSDLFAIGPKYQELFEYVFSSLQDVGIELEDTVQSETEILNELQLTTIKELAAVESILGILQSEQETLFESKVSSALETVPVDIVEGIVSKLSSLESGVWGNTLTAIEKLGGFATGTPEVPFDQLAMVHAGEMIIPAEQAEQIRSGESTLGTTPEAINEGTFDTGDIVNAINILTQIVAETQEEIIDQNDKSISTTKGILENNNPGVSIKTVGMV